MTQRHAILVALMFILQPVLNAQPAYNVIPQTGHTNTVLAMEYSPDGKYLATAGHDRVVLLWDTQTNLHFPLYGHTVGVDRLTFSPDNKLLASADFAGNLKVWEVSTKKVVAAINNNSDAEAFSVIRFVNNDELALQNEKMLKFWNYRTNAVTRKIPLKANYFFLHPTEPTAVLIETSAYASGARDYTPGGKLILYDYSRLAPLNDTWIKSNGSGWIRGAFSNSGKYLVLMSDNRLSLFDYPAKKVIWQVSIPFGPNTIMFSQDESMIMMAGNMEQHDLMIYDRASGKQIDRQPDFATMDIAYHSQLGLIATSYDNAYDAYDLTGPVNIYDIKTKQYIRKYKTSKYWLNEIKWDDDKKQLYVRGNKEEWVWDMATGNIVDHADAEGGLEWKGKVTGTERRIVGQEVMYVSPSGKYTAMKNVNKDAIELTDVASGTITEFPAQQSWGIGFSPDATRLYYCTGDDFFAYDIASRQLLKQIKYDKASVGKLAASPDGKLIAIGKFQNEWTKMPDKFYISDFTIDIVDAKTYQVVRTLEGHQGGIYGLQFTGDNKYLISMSMDGTIRFWDPATGKQKLFLYGKTESEFFLQADNGYYVSSKDGIDRIAFEFKGRVIPGKIFEIQMNRPDKVAEAIGYSGPAIISAFRKAFEKRIAQLGISEQQLRIEDLPVISVVNAPLTTVNTKTIQLGYEAIDNANELNHIKVLINNVPLYGRKGLSVKTKKSVKGKLDIPLTEGLNKIEISVVNAKGVASVPVSFEVFCTVKTQPDLYLITIGVDKFLEQDYNLSYAAKDAADIAALFESRKGQYGKFVHLPFIGMQATREKILAVKSTLEQSKPDDQVIIFAATHGLLDENYNYYLATYNMMFEKPSFAGLAYNDLEGLLDGIPARKKLILLDACHSGEVDASEITASTEAVKSVPGVKARGFKPVKKASSVGLENTFDLMKNLFADLRQGTGATVISSAGGVEFAIESEQWNNGAFTSALLEAIKTKKGDQDQDANISVGELKKYVFDRVSEITNGKQHPTSRVDNVDNDFPIISTIASSNGPVYSIAGNWTPKEMALYEGDKFAPISKEMNKRPLTIVKGADGFYYVNNGLGDIKLTQDDVNVYKDLTGDRYIGESHTTMVVRGYYGELTRYVK